MEATREIPVRFAVGVVVGLLTAPAPGEQTRRILLQKTRELQRLPGQRPTN